MQTIVYLIILLFPINSTDNIEINIVGKYTAAQCDYIKSTFPYKPNRFVMCANIQDI